MFGDVELVGIFVVIVGIDLDVLEGSMFIYLYGVVLLVLMFVLDDFDVMFVEEGLWVVFVVCGLFL